jgi:hypothetical protein
VPVPPYAAPTAGTGAAVLAPNRIGKTRNPWGVWLLSVITFGIYGLYWYYTINNELRNYDRGIKVEPVLSLLAIIFAAPTIYITFIVTLARTGGRIGTAQYIAGRSEHCSPVAGVLLGIIGFSQVYYQSQLNKVWDQYGNPEAGTPRPS